MVSLDLVAYPTIGTALKAVRSYHRHAGGTWPGLRAAALCRTGKFSRLISQRPTPQRWAMLCCWDSATALDDFVARSPTRAALLETASEHWYLALEPIRLRGSWRGWGTEAKLGEPLTPVEPVVALISGRVRPHQLPLFVWHNARVTAQLARAPGSLTSLALHDAPLTMTSFSIWRTTEAMNAFAYGKHTNHRSVIARTPDFDQRFFARFRLRASSGTWRGGKPVYASRT